MLFTAGGLILGWVKRMELRHEMKNMLWMFSVFFFLWTTFGFKIMNAIVLMYNTFQKSLKLSIIFSLIPLYHILLCLMPLYFIPLYLIPWYGTPLYLIPLYIIPLYLIPLLLWYLNRSKYVHVWYIPWDKPTTLMVQKKSLIYFSIYTKLISYYNMLECVHVKTYVMRYIIS